MARAPVNTSMLDAEYRALVLSFFQLPDLDQRRILTTTGLATEDQDLTTQERAGVLSWARGNGRIDDVASRVFLVTPIEDLLRRGSLCPGSACQQPQYATAVATAPSGVVYTAVRAYCHHCRTRAGVTTASDGYSRVAITPAGSSARAKAAGRRKEEWIEGVSSDPATEDDADMDATLEVTTRGFLGTKREPG